jgi:hypothetical protein
MNTRCYAVVLQTALLIGCGGQTQMGIGDGAKAKAKMRTADGKSVAGRGLAKSECKADKPDLESSEYDTSGDGTPDVIKIFKRVGSGSSSRLVLICRATDLNGDGIKDVYRHYNDEGQSTREEADRDFDGAIDEISYFENGEITHREIDTDGNGIIDLKIFYDKGKPLRAERDIGKRSTAVHWQPDVWEYYEGGRIVRIGTDLDGDTRVDRWDRSDGQKESSSSSSEPSGV